MPMIATMTQKIIARIQVLIVFPSKLNKCLIQNRELRETALRPDLEIRPRQNLQRSLFLTSRQLFFSCAFDMHAAAKPQVPPQLRTRRIARPSAPGLFLKINKFSVFEKKPALTRGRISFCPLVSAEPRSGLTVTA